MLLSQLVHDIFYIIAAAIFLNAILSWLRLPPDNPLVSILGKISYPFLAPIRSVLPTLGGLDLSPLVALLLISWIGGVASQTLAMAGL